MRVWLLAVVLAAAHALSASAETVAITNVTIVDVEDGAHRVGQTVIIRNGRIAKVGASEAVSAPSGARLVDGGGKYLIPGLWDMHVHSHREERWKYHYPLFLAHGVIGVRDAGSHLGSALAARDRVKGDSLAPRVIWGSPIVDGAPPFNSFGLSAEDAASARKIVEVVDRYGFDFLKVYDRLTPEAYFALAAEAKKRGLRVEGHVPLSLAPADTIAAGQTLIDHLTLILEACLPGALDVVHEENAKAPREVDSLMLMMGDRIADALEGYDAQTCGALFSSLAANGVWQVPTLIEMRGFFSADDPAVVSDPRIAWAPPGVVEEWREWGESAGAHDLANGRRVFAAQMRMIRPMKDAGVGLLAGTDASNEPWVFAGAGVHDEMLLFVEAGLTPLEALQTATLNPLLYLGRKSDARLISKGEAGDLILLEADPLDDISNTLKIAAVFAHGLYHDRAALDALIVEAETEAKNGKL